VVAGVVPRPLRQKLFIHEMVLDPLLSDDRWTAALLQPERH
jgi:hypothetical protein